MWLPGKQPDDPGVDGADPDVLHQLTAAIGDQLGGQTPVFLKERSGRLRSEPHRAIGRQLAGDPLPPLSSDLPIEPRPGRLIGREDGLRYGIDLLYGRNTGLFADARPMRRW